MTNFSQFRPILAGRPAEIHFGRLFSNPVDLYILVEKLIKITQLTRNKTEDWGWDPLSFCFSTTAKLISDLKVIKIKCKSEMRSALGKLLPLPDTALDKVLKSILNGDSLEEYKFEEVPAEDIGKINMMYGRLTLIFIILRDADGGAGYSPLKIQMSKLVL